MTHISTMVFVFVLSFVSVFETSAQEDFDAVRKRAMNSGSQQKAIEILVEFAGEETTSTQDEIRALDFLSRFCARRGKTRQANQFVTLRPEVGGTRIRPTIAAQRAANRIGDRQPVVRV